MIKNYKSSPMDEKRTIAFCLYQAYVFISKAEYKKAIKSLNNVQSLLGEGGEISLVLSKIEAFEINDAKEKLEILVKFAINNLSPCK